ncbi:MAG: hypothetical protein ABI780_06090 [Ardenticatenales bacterium]
MTAHAAYRILAVTTCALTIAACGGGETSGGGADDSAAVAKTPQMAAEVPTNEPTKPPATEAPAEAGTRNNPVPIGTTHKVGDWEVNIVSVDLDAADTVAAENQFNDPPADGHTFVMVNLNAKYVGAESGTFWTEISGKVLGSGGNTFSDSCGVIPASLTDEGETFGGATITGNLCYSAEAAQLDGALLIFEKSFSLSDDGRTFFALK